MKFIEKCVKITPKCVCDTYGRDDAVLHGSLHHHAWTSILQNHTWNRMEDGESTDGLEMYCYFGLRA